MFLILALLSTLTFTRIILDADLVETDTIKLNTLKADSLSYSDSILVDGFAMDFNDYFIHTTPILSSQKQYSMTISGTYKYASTIALDAAFIYCYFECQPCGINNPCANPVPNYQIVDSLLRPVEDTFNINHTYYYSFMGADTAMVFEFEDLGGYGDNSGLLNINIYEDSTNPYIRIDSTDVYVGEPGKGMVMRSPDGNCWKLTLDNSGNISTVQVSCPN